MFDTKVKTIVQDQLEITPEVTVKHRAEAMKRIGDDVRLVKTEQSSIPRLSDDGVDVVGNDYHIVSYWRLPTPDELAAEAAAKKAQDDANQAGK